MRIHRILSIAGLAALALAGPATRSAAARAPSTHAGGAASARVHSGRAIVAHRRPIFVNRSVFWPGYYDPFWYGSAWYGPPYAAYQSVVIQRIRIPKDAATVEMHVNQSHASLMIDGNLVGQARDFDDESHPLLLTAGRHVIELSREDYMTLRVEIDAVAGQDYDLHYRLEKGNGLDPRSIAAPGGVPNV